MNLLRFFVSMFDLKLGLSSGGGGANGSTKYEWNDDIKPFWQSTLNSGLNATNKPYQAYTDPRIAGLNGDQTGAIGATRQFVSEGGSPATQAANGQLQQTLQGDYLSGDQRNPYADATNGWRGVSADVDRNQYSGENPYFLDQLHQGMDEIGAKYRDYTAPDTQGQYVLNGTFGGGDYQRAVANNEGALAKNLSQYATGMFSDQYNRSADLEQKYLDSRLQNSQFDKSIGSSLDENAINRGNTDYEAERARQLGAVSGGQNEQQLALQRFQSLFDAGNTERTLDQQGLDQKYQNWFDANNYDWNQIAKFAGLLGGAQGGLAPNQTSVGGGSSALANGLGAALAGYGMFKL